ncbi:MAG: exopolyphosphatase [Arcobacter sp.]|nr:MAG: exopolyphosphatase [Arcobacter sp.]
MTSHKYRLITRSDMDGLVCGTLLKYIGIIDEIIFVHPKDMQDGLVPTSSNDITTNLPYVEGVHLCFDHHYSETLRNVTKANHIIDSSAPSAAEVVYQYYGGDQKFPPFFKDIMAASNKADSAQFSKEDILEPKGWDLLSFLMDSRTGLGRFKDFKISNYQLMMDLIDYCKDHTIEEILELEDVKERVELYFKYEIEFKQQLKHCSKLIGNVVVVDYLDEGIIYPGNRFLVYALFPKVNVSIHKNWGRDKHNHVYSVGKSIINKTCAVNIGELMLKHGGGGHEAAGGCQPLVDDAEIVLEDIINQLNVECNI